MPFHRSTSATAQKAYVPKVAPRRPEVVRPMIYMQDAMIDEFFGDTRAMKGKRPHGTSGLSQEHAEYGVELNYVDHAGIPWKDKVEKQHYQDLLSSQARAAIQQADVAAGVRKPPYTRQQRSWGSFSSSSTPDEDADERSTIAGSFDCESILDRPIRTASAELTGYVAIIPPPSISPPSAYYVPSDPMKRPALKVIKGPESFPHPAPPKHLDPQMTVNQPRPHGSARRRARDVSPVSPPAPLSAVDPVEQARLDFMKTSFAPGVSAAPCRRPSFLSIDPARTATDPIRDRPRTPRSDGSSKVSPTSRSSSRAESAYPSTREGSRSRSSTHSSSVASGASHETSSTRQSDKYTRLPQVPSASSTYAQRGEGRPLPPTVQPKHTPTKAVSNSSLRSRFTTNTIPGRATASDNESGGRRPSLSLPRSVSALFRKGKGN